VEAEVKCQIKNKRSETTENTASNAAMLDNLEYMQKALSNFDKNVPKKDV